MACSLEAVSIGKLENLLQCSICLGTVKDPRTLPCFHSYCKACLERFVKNHREKAVGRQVKDFNCPKCRSQFTLNPGEEVADMTPNHFIFNMLEVMAVQDRVKGVPCSHCQKSSVGRCVDCEVFLCQECLTDHNKYRGFVNHSILSMDELAKPENQRKIRRKLHCQEHKKTLKFYCETCQELICRDCTDFNHEKPEHSWLPVEKVAEKQKQLLDESCTALENKLKRGNQALRKVTDVTQSLAKVKERVKLDINARRDTILKAVTRQVNEKAQDLTNQVDGIYSRKHDSLAKQKEEFQAYVKKLESCVDLSKGILKKGTDEEILSSAKMMKENIEKVQKEIPKTMEPNGDDGICYKYGPINIMTIGKVCAEMGTVEDKNKTDQRIGSNQTRGMRTNNLENPKDDTFNANTSECPICLDQMKNPRTLNKCNHTFCTTCIDNAFKHQKKCPICSEVYGQLTGNQPPGQMSTRKISSSLPGYENCGTIIIYYHFNNGKQGPNHPKPGRPYTGTSRRGYLPDNDEGRKVLNLLRKAFDQKLTFTIGRSSTTGAENAVIWNDISHKTNTFGGSCNYGYPDPTYLTRVKEELAAKGIKE